MNVCQCSLPRLGAQDALPHNPQFFCKGPLQSARFCYFGMVRMKMVWAFYWQHVAQSSPAGVWWCVHGLSADWSSAAGRANSRDKDAWRASRRVTGNVHLSLGHLRAHWAADRDNSSACGVLHSFHGLFPSRTQLPALPREKQPHQGEGVPKRAGRNNSMANLSMFSSSSSAQLVLCVVFCWV